MVGKRKRETSDGEVGRRTSADVKLNELHAWLKDAVDILRR